MIYLDQEILTNRFTKFHSTKKNTYFNITKYCFLLIFSKDFNSKLLVNEFHNK